MAAPPTTADNPYLQLAELYGLLRLLVGAFIGAYFRRRTGFGPMQGNQRSPLEEAAEIMEVLNMEVAAEALTPPK